MTYRVPGRPVDEPLMARVAALPQGVVTIRHDVPCTALFVAYEANLRARGEHFERYPSRPYLRLRGTIASVSGELPYGTEEVRFAEGGGIDATFEYEFTDEQLASLALKGMYRSSFEAPRALIDNDGLLLPALCDVVAISPEIADGVPLVFVSVKDRHLLRGSLSTVRYDLEELFEAAPDAGSDVTTERERRLGAAETLARVPGVVGPRMGAELELPRTAGAAIVADDDELADEQLSAGEMALAEEWAEISRRSELRQQAARARAAGIAVEEVAKDAGAGPEQPERDGAAQGQPEQESMARAQPEQGSAAAGVASDYEGLFADGPEASAAAEPDAGDDVEEAEEGASADAAADAEEAAEDAEESAPYADDAEPDAGDAEEAAEEASADAATDADDVADDAAKESAEEAAEEAEPDAGDATEDATTDAEPDALGEDDEFDYAEEEELVREAEEAASRGDAQDAEEDDDEPYYPDEEEDELEAMRRRNFSERVVRPIGRRDDDWEDDMGTTEQDVRRGDEREAAAGARPEEDGDRTAAGGRAEEDGHRPRIGDSDYVDFFEMMSDANLPDTGAEPLV